MKQVININFQGQVVPIEVSAFELLKNYTESLRNYFANEEGKEEIINDIENRISELFQERLKKGATCITDDDVNAIIKSVGRPEDFEEAGESNFQQTNNAGQSSSQQETQNAGQTSTHKRLFRNENHKVIGGVCSGFANYFGTDPIIMRIITVIFFGVTFIPYIILWVALPSTASVEIGSARKKLYRDADDKIVAGVCSGIGNYFGINPWIPRVLFLLPFLSFIFHRSHWVFMDFPNFMHFNFSPGSVFVYIILWLVFPEATTTAEKLEMKGEKVDINSIKNSVMEEMKDVKQRAQKFGQEAKTFATEKGKTVGAEMGNIAKRSSRSLGDIIVLMVKGFAYFIIGCVGFGLVLALFILAIVSVSIFPLKDFVLTDGWENILAWGTLVFFIAIPVIGVITWIIRRLAKIKSNGRIMRFTFISLWIIGWVCFIMLISFVSKDFRTSNDMVIENIVLPNPIVNKLEITSPDDMMSYNYKKRMFHFNPFNITDEDTYYLNTVHFRIKRSTNDSFQLSIIKLANGKNQRDAENIASKINYTLTQTDTLLKTPLGIPIDRENKFRSQHVIITIAVPIGKRIKIDQSIWEMSSRNFNINWDNGDWDNYWGDEERGWTTNTEYIQTAKGLYKLNGEPADESKNLKKKIKINGNGIEITVDDNDDIKQQKLDSLEERKDKEKDSIENIIEQKIEKEKEKIEKENQPAAYMKPTGLSVINSFM
jgi:phage shock protein PspC (stress-responsive transcriptional regulator)